MKNTVTFESVKGLGFDKLLERAKTFVKEDLAVQAKEDKFRKKIHEAAKVIAALQIVFAEKQDKSELPRGLSFREFHKKQTGEYPNNHFEQAAGTFRNYVLTGLMTEADFDKAAGDWLCTAHTIAKESGFDTKSKSMQEAAALMKDRPSDTAKQLREMKREMKGQIESDDEETGGKKTVELNPQLIVAMLRAAAAKKLLGVVYAELIATVHHAKDLGVTEARALYHATQDLADAWDKSGIEPELLAKWSDEHNTATPTPHTLKIVTAEGTREVAIA